MAVAGRTLVVLGLLLAAQFAAAAKLTAENGVAYIALIATSDNNEQAFLDTNTFVSNRKFVTVAGRPVLEGLISNTPALLLKTGGSTISAAIATQALLDRYEVRLIINFGSAGATNNSLNIGDVVSLKRVAHISEYRFLQYGADNSQYKGQLKIGDYNLPEAGENYLEGLYARTVQVYEPSADSAKTTFWLLYDKDLTAIANAAQGDLEQCYSGSCLSNVPKFAAIKSGATADVYIQNVDYREYVFKQFKASTVDTESASVLLVAKSNGVPVVGLRGISNLAGRAAAESDVALSYLASVNVAKAVVAFVEGLNSYQLEA